MKLKLASFLILIFSTQIASAQIEPKIIVGINPFAPIGLTNIPRAEVFGEYYFSQKHSISVDIGIGNFGAKFDSVILKNSGFRTAISYKKHIDFKNLKGLYFGLNAFYWAEQRTELFYGVHSDSVTKFTDAMGLKRKAIGASFIIGYQTLIKPTRLSLDIYAGLGFKNLDIQNTNREYNPQMGDYSTQIDCGIGPCIGTLSEESYSRINPTFGIRIGYLICKRTKAVN